MVHEHDDGAVRVLTLDRPEARNAFDRQQYVDLAAAIARAGADPGVHVLVITGAGTAFSAGQDLKEMAAMMSGELVHEGGHGFPELLDQLETFGKPLIAAVNGAAAGVGMTMLLHCDIVFVSDTARMRVPFAEMGVPPEAGSSVLMPDALGWQRAAELLFTARWVPAEEAVRVGLALEMLPGDRLMTHTMALATQIAGNNPVAVQSAKRLMLAGRGERSREARDRENDAYKPLFSAGRGGATSGETAP